MRVKGVWFQIVKRSELKFGFKCAVFEYCTQPASLPRGGARRVILVARQRARRPSRGGAVSELELGLTHELERRVGFKFQIVKRLNSKLVSNMSRVQTQVATL